MAIMAQYGSKGNHVKKLQEGLKHAGYDLKVDGVFGSETKKMVETFQKANGLAVDGIVGTQTWGSLNKNNLVHNPNEGISMTNYSAGPGTSNKSTVGNGFDYKDFSYDDFEYDKTYTAPEDFKYDDFQYGAYTESQAVTDAKNALNANNANKPGAYQESEAVAAAKAALAAQLANKPGAYQSQWQSQLDASMNKILNREKFSYDLNGDALYQQYKDKYIQQGKMAMADTMGQAAAMTGGYGNSYAASVGNQAYQQSLQQLNDIVPELYQMAYDRYKQEGQDLYNQYGMLSDRENADYGRYRDSVNDWTSERDYLTGRYDSERNFDYGQYRDSVADWRNERDYLAGRYDSERNFDYSKYTDDRNFQYNKYADDRNLAYNQYVDDRNFDYNQFIDDRNYEYGKYVDDRNFEYGKYADDKSYAYNDYRDKIADAQWKANFDEALRQYNEQFAYQKDRDAVADSQWDQSFQYQKDRDTVADSQWQKEFDEAQRQYNESMSFSKTQYNDSKKDKITAGNSSGSSSSGSSGGSGGNGGSGGTGNTGNTGNTNNKNTGGVSSTITNKAGSFSNNDDLANYLDGLTASGVITESQADALYAENKSPEQVGLNKRSWTLVDDGGVNWLWGVDNNAVVKDQYGNTYKLGKLVDALVAEGMSKSEAKDYVKKLQKQLGA